MAGLSTMIDHATSLLVLQEAAHDLDAGRFEAVIAALGVGHANGGPVGRALLGVARGLEAEATGRADEAGALMEGAFASGPDLPAAALRALLGFFRRSGRQLLAHHAFLMLQLLEPDPLDEVMRDLPHEDWAHYAHWAMRTSVTSGRHATYVVAGMKTALRRRQGPEGAALVLEGVRGPQGERRAVPRVLTPLVGYLQEAGLEYEEVIAAGPAPETTGVRLIGRLPDAPVDTRRSRSLAAAVLPDVVVTGRSAILLTGERALMDVQEDELSRRPVDLSVDPIVAAADGNELLLLEPADRDALPRLAEAVWLNGVHSVAYGHWILEFLPKVWALMTRPGFERVPLLVDARMPPQHLEAVRLFTGSDNPVVVLEAHDSVRVERLWVASAPVYLPAGPLPVPPGPRTRVGLDDAGFVRLMARIGRTLEAVDTTGTPARLYLARKPSQHRRVADAEEVEARLADAGFQSHDLGELPFVEQLRLIRGADWVIGPAGSSMENVIFGRQGLRVGVFVPTGPEDVAWLAQECRALGIELTAIVGEIVQEHSNYRWMSDYRIDPSLVAAYLETSRPGASDEAATAPRATPATIRIWTDEAAPSVPDVRVRR